MIYMRDRVCTGPRGAHKSRASKKAFAKRSWRRASMSSFRPAQIYPALLLPLLDTASYSGPASLQPVSSKLDY